MAPLAPAAPMGPEAPQAKQARDFDEEIAAAIAELKKATSMPLGNVGDANATQLGETRAAEVNKANDKLDALKAEKAAAEAGPTIASTPPQVTPILPITPAAPVVPESSPVPGQTTESLIQGFTGIQSDFGKMLQKYSVQSGIAYRAATSADQMMIPDAEKERIRQRDTLAAQAKQQQLAAGKLALATPGMSDFADFQSKRAAEQAATKSQFDSWKTDYDNRTAQQSAAAMSKFESWKSEKLGTGGKDRQDDIVRVLIEGNKKTDQLLVAAKNPSKQRMVLD